MLFLILLISLFSLSVTAPMPPGGYLNSTSEQKLQIYRDFCCECKYEGVNCPICHYGGPSICPIDDPDPGHLRHVDVFWRYYEALRPSTKHYFAFSMSKLWWWDTVRGTFIHVDGWSCVPNLVTSYFSGYSTVAKCTVVVAKADYCPQQTIALPNACAWDLVKEVHLDSDNKACMAPFRRYITAVLSRGGRGLCTRDKTFILQDFLYKYVLATSKETSVPDNIYPVPYGRVDNVWYFKTIDITPTEDFLFSFLRDQVGTDCARVSTYRNYNVVSEQKFLVDPQVYNGLPSHFLDKVVAPTSCTLNSLSGDSDYFCNQCLSTLKGYIAPTDPRPIDRTLIYSVGMDNIVVPEMNFSFPCSKLDKMGRCTFTAILNDFQHNITESLNQSLYTNMLAFLDGLGRNDSTLLLQDAKGSLIGNWFSGIFASLIRPFFDAFVEVVLSAFIPPIFEALIEVMKLLSDLITRLTKSFSGVFSTLAGALGDLLSATLNLILGLIIAIETQILLFEYTLLFLIIMWRWIKDWIFALVIVIIVMLVLGVRRKSPSLILYFVSEDYFIFNFTYYYNKTFDWSYKLSYYSDGKSYNYFFNNATITTSTY